MKITAVKWLVEKFMTENTTKEGWHEIFEQAKSMEKDQIIMAYHKGEHNGALRVYHKGDTKYYRDVSSGMYYSRTFKSK
jgi:hypothetical protein